MIMSIALGIVLAAGRPVAAGAQQSALVDYLAARFDNYGVPPDEQLRQELCGIL